MVPSCSSSQTLPVLIACTLSPPNKPLHPTVSLPGAESVKALTLPTLRTVRNVFCCSEAWWCKKAAQVGQQSRAGLGPALLAAATQDSVGLTVHSPDMNQKHASLDNISKLYSLSVCLFVVHVQDEAESMCDDVPVEVKGQLYGVDSSPFPWFRVLKLDQPACTTNTLTLSAISPAQVSRF